MTRTVDPYEDTLDSRDIIARIEELETIIDDGEPDLADKANLVSLKMLAAEAAPYCDDWESGATLIRYSYFTDYAKELVTECGWIKDDVPSWIEIDWEATAENLKQDYTEVEFDGVAYFVR